MFDPWPLRGGFDCWSRVGPGYWCRAYRGGVQTIKLPLSGPHFLHGCGVVEGGALRSQRFNQTQAGSHTQRISDSPSPLRTWFPRRATTASTPAASQGGGVLSQPGQLGGSKRMANGDHRRNLLPANWNPKDLSSLESKFFTIETKNVRGCPGFKNQENGRVGRAGEPK